MMVLQIAPLCQSISFVRKIITVSVNVNILTVKFESILYLLQITEQTDYLKKEVEDFKDSQVRMIFCLFGVIVHIYCYHREFGWK